MSNSPSRPRLYTLRSSRVPTPRLDADAVGQFTESIARFFGTGSYLLIQTIVVIVWIVLNVFAIQLHGAIEQQSKIDWQKLLETDPIEYMRQERIFNERQAAFAKAKSELAQFQEMQQAEQQKHLGEFLSNQQQQLVAKLPEWKDAAKRTAESAAIKQYLAQEGFTPEEIGSFVDHRQVVLSRKAMLYDNLMERASKATQRVATVPTKVERPGNGDNGSSERNAEAMKRLTKSGRIEDAAAVFAGIL